MRYTTLFLMIFCAGCINDSGDKTKLQVDTDSLNINYFNDSVGAKGIILWKSYFNSLNIPYKSLDSLVEKTFQSDKCLAFTSEDDSIFNNKRTDISYKYISIQDTVDFYNILVYRQQDMENCIFIYSFDKDLSVIDSEILFCCGGGSVDPNQNVLIDGYVVNMLEAERKAYFREDLIISSNIEMYCFEDTLTKSKDYRVGRQKIVTYKQDQNGHFKKVKEDSFSKDFADFKYWY